MVIDLGADKDVERVFELVFGDTDFRDEEGFDRLSGIAISRSKDAHHAAPLHGLPSSEQS